MARKIHKVRTHAQTVARLVEPAQLHTDEPPALDLDDLRRRHAEQFAAGNTARVSTIRFELDWLRHNGALVDVDLTGLSCLTGTISLAALGFPDSIALAALGQVIMNLADAGLLPEWLIAFNRRSSSVTMALCRPMHLRRAKSVESATRQALARHSYRQGLERVLGSYYWVPVTAYTAWKADFDWRQADLAAVRADLLADLDVYAAEIAAGWRLIAREAYAAIVGRDPDYAYRQSEDTFSDLLVQAAVAHLPGPDAIAAITLDYTTPVLLAPSEVEAELARRDAIANERTVAAARAAVVAAEHRGRERIVETEAFAQARRIQAEAEADARMARDRAEFERRRLEAMHEAELEHARAQIAEMESPFRQILDSLRTDVYNTVQAVLASIAKHGHVRGKTAEQAENMIANFRLLNVAGDAELDRLLRQLETTLRRPGAESARDTAAVADALRAIAAETQSAAQSIAARLEPSQASMVML